jgi:hypothetical protein
MSNIETIELDEATVQTLRNLSAMKQQHITELEHIDDVAQAVIKTVMNVKGLTGDWALTSSMKLAKTPDLTLVVSDAE